MHKKVKALALLSGGLDSILAVRVIQEQGIEVTGLSFYSPFFSPDKATFAASHLGIELKLVDITLKLLEVLKSPKYGFGKNINPCIDCHGLMFREAGFIMEKEGFDFIITGEVLGERPMSQNKNSLDIVKKLSLLGNNILRPLSAKLLAETDPEKKGLVDREKLLDISGRGRKRQIELAKKYNITKYPSPAGGCKLTESSTADRVRTFISFEKLKDKPEEIRRELEIVLVGRQIKLFDKFWIVVGKNKMDNEKLISLFDKNKDIKFFSDEIPGPVIIAVNGKDLPETEDIIKKSAEICARYSDVGEGNILSVVVTNGDKNFKLMTKSCPDEEIKQWLI